MWAVGLGLLGVGRGACCRGVVVGWGWVLLGCLVGVFGGCWGGFAGVFWMRFGVFGGTPCGDLLPQLG